MAFESTRIAAAVTAVLLLAHPLIAPADYLKFLKSSPLAYFKDDDYELMAKNAREVLDSETPRARQEWRNPKTGSSGLAEVRKQFVATDGAPCKTLYVMNRAGGVEGAATHVVCKYAERGWLLHPDAVPAEPASDEPASDKK